MKKLVYVLVAAAIASCTGPKYTASFKSYDRDLSHNEEGATKSQKNIAHDGEPTPLLAGTSVAPVEFKVAPTVEERKTYIQMTKVERKELRQQLKSEVKSFVKAQKKILGIESRKATAAMDNDLKMAAIFGAIGLVLGALYSVNSIIGFVGFVAIVIALVFLIKWLMRQ